MMAESTTNRRSPAVANSSKSDRDRPLTDLGALEPSRALHARFQGYASDSQSCIGCRHRKRLGSQTWCANLDLPAQQRPSGDAMKGCSAYTIGDPDDDGRTGVRKGLAKLAARRSVR